MFEEKSKNFFFKIQVALLIIFGLVVVWYVGTGVLYFHRNVTARKNVTHIFTPHTKP